MAYSVLIADIDDLIIQDGRNNGSPTYITAGGVGLWLGLCQDDFQVCSETETINNHCVYFQREQREVIE